MDLQRKDVQSNVPLLRQDKQSTGIKPMSSDLEKNFPKHWLFISTAIFVIVAAIGISLSLAFQGDQRITILVVTMVMAHLASNTLPFNADWYWRKIEKEEEQ